MNNRCYIHWIFLLLICLLSIITRVEVVTGLSYGLEGDELECTSVPAIQNAGLDSSLFTLWSSQINAYPVSPWLMGIAYSLLGTDVYSARIGLAVILSFALIPFYILVTQLSSKLSAIFCLPLFAFSSYYVSLGLVAEQPPFAPFPYITTLLFLVLLFCKFRRPVGNKALLVYAFLSSSFSVITMLTYNQNYLSPFIVIGTFFLFLLVNKEFRKKAKILILIMLCIPYILFGPRIVGTFLRETQKSYALEHSTILREGDSYRLDTSHITANASTFYKVLTETTGRDMIISHTNAIVPILVLFLCTIGLVYSLIFFKNYYFILPLIIQVVIQHIILGLNLPRMWINTVILIYILVALGIYAVEQLVNKLSKVYPAIFLLSMVIVTVITVHREFRIVLDESIKNDTFRPEWEKLYAVLRSQDLHNVQYYLDKHNSVLLTSLYPLVWVEQKLPNDVGEVSNNIKIVTTDNILEILNEYPSINWRDSTNGILLASGGEHSHNRALIFDTRAFEGITPY